MPLNSAPHGVATVEARAAAQNITLGFYAAILVVVSAVTLAGQHGGPLQASLTFLSSCGGFVIAALGLVKGPVGS